MQLILSIGSLFCSQRMRVMQESQNLRDLIFAVNRRMKKPLKKSQGVIEGSTSRGNLQGGVH